MGARDPDGDWATLTLNPTSQEGPRNPLCPECEEPIVPLENEAERRFVCGCDVLWQYQFGGDGELVIAGEVEV